MMLTTATGRTCVRCATFYTAEEVASGQAFLPGRSKDASYLRGVCRPCEEKAADQRKGVDRTGVKANDTRRRHAIKLSGPRQANGNVAWYDPELTAAQLETCYGWWQRQLTHDIKFRYGNGCDYCHHPYKEMGHGLADITIDIYDPRLPPDYSNTRWCCMTCQRRKGLLTPEQWAIKQRIYRKWETVQQMPPEQRGMLF